MDFSKQTVSFRRTIMFKQLQDMALFTLVVELGSFTAAAKRVALPKSSVSKRISQLEQQLGLRLLTRTTRRLSLTFAGERYLVHCQEMIAASERAQNSMQLLKVSPSGRIKVTAPAGLAIMLLAEIVSDFQTRHPHVAVEVNVSDEISDLVADGYDVALRTGEPEDSMLIGRRLGESKRYIVASPGYLKASTPINEPEQLHQHRIIAHRSWTQCALRQQERVFHWLLPAQHMTDNLLYARQCALLGGGVTLLPDFLCRQALDSGDLVAVLSDWQVDANQLYLVYPSRKLNPPALTLFINEVVNYRLFK
jgi:DNA-binding transcriptional LysR family regulator